MPQRRRRRERTLEELLSWLLGPSSQRAADSAGDARALRKRIAWCWRIRPRIAPPDARRHTVMADGTYMVFCFNVCSTGSAVFFRSVG